MGRSPCCEKMGVKKGQSLGDLIAPSVDNPIVRKPGTDVDSNLRVHLEDVQPKWEVSDMVVDLLADEGGSMIHALPATAAVGGLSPARPSPQLAGVVRPSFQDILASDEDVGHGASLEAYPILLRDFHLVLFPRP
ncbi:hypothetical protein V6N12_010178 [Hibiscus sabdariffa]|uniref:Uncharacterized protein n=1 Tax=Hibiscus sabdariffa TaxID=183260 RepID=A0ABR2ECY6_9ROSI